VNKNSNHGFTAKQNQMFTGVLRCNLATLRSGLS
jgi:hypothetical protein